MMRRRTRSWLPEADLGPGLSPGSALLPLLLLFIFWSNFYFSSLDQTFTFYLLIKLLLFISFLIKFFVSFQLYMSIVQLVSHKSQKQDYLQFSLLLFQSQGIPATIMGENQQNRKENQSNPSGLDRKIRDRSKSPVRQGGQSTANLWSPFLFGQSKCNLPSISFGCKMSSGQMSHKHFYGWHCQHCLSSSPFLHTGGDPNLLFWITLPKQGTSSFL